MGPPAECSAVWDDEVTGILITGSVRLWNPAAYCVLLKVTEDHSVNTNKGKN
jgi:hypothetical protein